jgi:hypothetical protein
MNHIYEARALCAEHGFEMPRINVRVTDSHPTIAGIGAMRGNTIWITEQTINAKWLRQTVFHELLHAIKGTKHVSDCKLMSPVIDPNVTDSQTDELFIKYMSE